jgi:hypothetical protein
MKKIAAVIALLLATTLTACADDADVASENLSKDADNFKINRRIIFYNGITETYILTIEGFCSIDDDGSQLEVTCKVGDDAFKKHFLRVSDNVTYFVEQIDSANVSTSHYKVVFKPSVIIPDVDAR